MNAIKPIILKQKAIVFNEAKYGNYECIVEYWSLSYRASYGTGQMSLL